MEYTMTIEADVKRLDEVIDFVNGHLEEWGCPLREQMRIDVAVEEVYVNVAHYAYEEGKGDVSILFKRASENAMSITFIDKGIPYDPLKKEDPDVTLPVDKRPIGGLGIYMVKSIADEIFYERRDDKNVLMFTKAW